MRIIEALKFHYKKHLLSYGIVSSILSIIGAVFSSDVVRGIYKALDESFGLTVLFGFVYCSIIVAVAIPMVMAVMWIFDKKGE